MMSPFAEIFFVAVILICIWQDIRSHYEYQEKRRNNKWYEERNDG